MEPEISSEHLPIVSTLRRLGGVARWRAISQEGITRNQFKRAIASGEVIRYAYGVYALPTSTEFRRRVVTLGGVPACLTAASERGWWVLPDQAVPHIAVNRGVRLDGVVLHRGSAPLTDVDVAIQILRCASELSARAAITYGMRKRLFTQGMLLDRLVSNHDSLAREIVKDVDLAAESILEVASGFHLRNAGLQVVSQYYIRGLGHSDQLVDGVLALELMGKAYHIGEKEFAEDLRRFNEYTLHGIPVLRVGYATVIYHPERFVEMVKEALKAVRGRRHSG